jgi:death-on-curing protein
MVHLLTLEEILIIHDRVIRQFGGSHGVRDVGLLQSAIERPKAGFGDFEAYPDIFMKAAVLGFSLLKNHPFIDGNKRTSVTATLIFLRENNIRLKVETHEIKKLALDIANNKLQEKEVASWLKKYSHQVE